MSSIKVKNPGKQLSCSTYKISPYAYLGEDKGPRFKVCWSPWESFSLCNILCLWFHLHCLPFART